jgi:NhaP-type Na+/H+ or K+/H+ antiporter
MRKRETQAILLGTVLGALSGAALGWLYSRSQRSTNRSKPLQPGQVVKLGAAVVALARQFIDLLPR